MIPAGGILLCHLVGDYLIQNEWMAVQKTKRWFPAFVHGVTYTLPFLLLTQSPLALLVIGGTHMIIDRFRLAKYLVWAKNQLAPGAWRYPFWAAQENGFPSTTPVWLATWLMIIVDNLAHVLINFGAVLWL